MTTDPPPSEFEDVQIDNWQTRLPSAICTNKEIFDEIFSLETWKAVLQPDQRDRIMKMLPPEVLKIPGAAEKTIEDLFSKKLSNFGTNPLDELFDKLDNGHCDPEVVETKANIIREWRKESLRLKKHYHTKLLQDMVVSRENTFRKLIPISPKHSKNGKKNNNKYSASKKNGKPATNGNGHALTNGVYVNGTKNSGSGSKNSQPKFENAGSPTFDSSVDKKSTDTNKNKRGRIEAALISPQTTSSDTSSEGPAKKRAKQTAKSKTSKKVKEQQPQQQHIIVVTTSQQSPSPSLLSSSQLMSSFSQLGGNGSIGGTTQKTPSLVGTLSSRSSVSNVPVPTPPTSLLESLTLPINPPTPNISFSSGSSGSSDGSSKQFSKMFPNPVISPAVASSVSSYLPSPVQSSPILASQLQAPPPISVNLNALTGIGGVTSSKNGSVVNSPSHSSITLNYTQTPPPGATVTSAEQHHQQQGQINGLLDDGCSSDEYEFETIEPTIGFSGPPLATSSNTLSKSILSTAISGQSSSDFKKELVGGTGIISQKELANIQKCSLLTNCLTQPLSSNSSSAAAVSAALANNILTSTPVAINSAGGIQQIQIQQQPHKIIVTTGGGVLTPNSLSNQQHQQQLQKFLTAPASSTSSSSSTVSQAQKILTQQQLDAMFQQQPIQGKNVVSVTATSAQANVIDAGNLVNSIMTSSSKDLLASLSASLSSTTTGATTPSPTLIHHIQQQPSSQAQNILPIAVNLQSGVIPQLKPPFVRTPSNGSLLQGNAQSLGNNGLLSSQILSIPAQQSSQSLVLGHGSTLNTQNLQLPSGVLSSSTSGNLISISSSSNNDNNNSTKIGSSSVSSSIPNLLDADDLNLNLGNFTLGGLGTMNLDIGSVNLTEIESNGMGVVTGSVGMDSIKLDMDCGIDKMDDLSGVLDGNPFDSIPNLSDELDGLDLDMVDGICDFEGLLSEEKQYASFFSLIRDVLCSTRDHRMTFVCLEKTIRKWQITPGAALNPWYIRVIDWNSALIIALNFLAGNYQDVHPEDFVPYIEYKFKTKYYQWIGAGRDGDNNLTPLCSLWLDNLDKLPHIKKSEGDGDEPEEEEDDNEDSDTCGGGESSDSKKKIKRPQTPPPPRFTTDWTVRPSTQREKEDLRNQERSRFDNPHKAFTYRVHGYESVVGPVKGVYSSQTGVTNKARGHSLLVDDRPPYVTILALVRDAVARLPNGEGTRSEICEMLRDSAYLAPEASNVTLNSVVSGALDRLHYERDPCVRYDSHKKSWIYLHRDRTQEQFERLHHNRSYTKSTKSRHNSSRKSRKGSSKSSASSLASATSSILPHGSSSTSSSQSSISTSEISQQSNTNNNNNGVNATSTTIATIVGAGGVVSTTSGASLVTLPSMSTINPSMHNQISTLSGNAGSTLQQQIPSVKQTVGILNVTSNPVTTGIQGSSQHQSVIATAIPPPSGHLQQQTSFGNTRDFVTLSSTGQQDGQTPQAGTLTQSLNEVLAAAAGLRFQPSSGGTPVVLSQNILGQQQVKHGQGGFIQDTTGQAGTTRLVLQQQSTTQSQSVGISTQQPQGQQQSAGRQGPTNAAPSQILLGASSAVLKLAGNLRLGEGLRLAQLRLPTGGGTPNSTANTLSGTNNAPLRIPQHRILLARGAIPGQHQTQGVLLGQTANGQTIILSAGPAGSSLAGLQALSAGNNSPISGHIGIQVPISSSQTQLDMSPQAVQTPALQQQQQNSFNQQQQSLKAVQSNQGSTTKFGIITSVASSSSSIMASTTGCPLSIQSTTGSQGILTTFANTTARLQKQSLSTTSLPTTSISLPASFMHPVAQNSTANGSFSIPSSTISVSTTGHSNSQGHQSQQHSQQQILLTTGTSGGATTLQQSQTSPQQSGGNLTAVQIQGSSLSQAVANMAQQQQQSVMFATSSQNINVHQQGQSQTGQAHHQLTTAPIIIRSAQGDFVSFGIPSHISLGKGVQGIKVIPFQAGKQTVLARIVPPSSGTSQGTGFAGVTGAAVSGGNTLLTTSSITTSNHSNTGIMQQHQTNVNNNGTATIMPSGLQLPVQQQQQSALLPTTTGCSHLSSHANNNNNNNGNCVIGSVSGTSSVTTPIVSSTAAGNNQLSNNTNVSSQQ